ncbi:CCR4-NOT transcription complex subunit 9 isoform X2 [Medicago truncatula]|uniref:CCR4-NOT transcription complex subunit 9 isoform X2 n=1 Tax=Medicago truncatula TaxID=3880 RepID=UPI00196784E8|nr:CCR4-NOT transcription complex subunit 9-like isoform X2 [Medicago truncatula]
MKNIASFVSPIGASIKSSTTTQSMSSMERLVIELSNPDLRENALRVLSKFQRIRLFPELAPLLWNSYGTIAILVQEITSIYPTIQLLNLTQTQSTRVCNVLALLQCVASHPDTKMSFLNASMPLYFYPFLQTTSELAQFEHLRLASLGVIGALVKVNTKESIDFLLRSEIIPLCLCNMEIGKELSKTVATFIIQKIMSNDDGLIYICGTAERFFAVVQVFNMVLESVGNQPSHRLMKLLIPCYSLLSQHHRACNALKRRLPNMLKTVNTVNCLREDEITWSWVMKLHENIGVNQVPLVPGGGNQ